MTTEEVLDYLKMWARINGQGIRGESVYRFDLENEIDRIKEILEER